MKQRVISGLVMVPLLILVALAGPFLKAAVFLIAAIGVREFFKGFEAIDVHPSYPAALISTVLLYVLDLIMDYTDVIAPGMRAYMYIFWLTVSLVLCMLYMFKIEKRTLADGMATITGIVYVIFFSYHIVLADEVFHEICGVSPVWIILITAFCTDIGAYFGGYFLGKHKLCPTISPKKTIEGAVSGALSSLLVTFLFVLLFMTHEHIAAFMLVGLAGGILSQIGDLTASIFKRKMGIKDYGKLIPGHGGVMDRFDSVLFTGPLVFYALVFIYGVSL